jgi:hypothetical protein
MSNAIGATLIKVLTLFPENLINHPSADRSRKWILHEGGIETDYSVQQIY